MQTAILMTMLIMTFYFIIGVGLAKMVSEVKARRIRLIDIIAWPICAIVYAFCNDIS